MKIWSEHAGDHSYNLKIIGTFKTEDDAQKAVDSINGLIEASKDPQTTREGRVFSEEVMDYMRENNMSFPLKLLNLAYIITQLINVEIELKFILMRLPFKFS